MLTEPKQGKGTPLTVPLQINPQRVIKLIIEHKVSGRVKVLHFPLHKLQQNLITMPLCNLIQNLHLNQLLHILRGLHLITVGNVL
jgi:hypothetical protein